MQTQVIPPTETTTAARIRLEGLVKSFATPTGKVRAVGGVDLDISKGETRRPARPERRGQVDPDRHAARAAATRHRPGRAVRRARRRRRSTKGRSARCCRPAASCAGSRSASSSTMMASLYPDPLPVDEVLELAGIGAVRASGAPRSSRAARRSACASRSRSSCNPELLVLDEPTVGDGRRGAPRVLDDDARRSRPRAAPCCSRRTTSRRRTPTPTASSLMAARSRRRRRAADRDQGAWSGRARSARRCPAPTLGALGRLPGVTAPSGAATPSCCAAPTPTRRSARCSTSTRTRATSRSAAPGLEEAFLELTATTTTTRRPTDELARYTRFELLRTFRNRRFFVFSLGFPLVLYFLIAGPNRNEHDLGGSRPLGAALLHGRPRRVRRDERPCSRAARASPASARSAGTASCG